MASESSASWAIDSEPIQARGVIVKYFVIQSFLPHIRLLNFPQCLVGLVEGGFNKLVTSK